MMVTVQSPEIRSPRIGGTVKPILLSLTVQDGSSLVSCKDYRCLTIGPLTDWFWLPGPEVTSVVATIYVRPYRF